MTQRVSNSRPFAPQVSVLPGKLLKGYNGSSTLLAFLQCHPICIYRCPYTQEKSFENYLWNSMTSTSFVFTELANTMKYGEGFLYNLVFTAFHRMKYGGGVLYNLVFTEWRHCVSQNILQNLIFIQNFALLKALHGFTKNIYDDFYKIYVTSILLPFIFDFRKCFKFTILMLSIPPQNWERRCGLQILQAGGSGVSSSPHLLLIV